MNSEFIIASIMLSIVLCYLIVFLAIVTTVRKSYYESGAIKELTFSFKWQPSLIGGLGFILLVINYPHIRGFFESLLN